MALFSMFSMSAESPENEAEAAAKKFEKKDPNKDPIERSKIIRIKQELRNS